MPTHLQGPAMISTVQFSIALTLAVMAMILQFSPFPKNKEFSDYTKSRHYCATAMAILTIHFLIQWVTGYRITNKEMSIMINLTFIFPATVLQGISSLIILHGKFGKTKLIMCCGVYVVQLLLIWLTWLYAREHIIYAQVTAAVLFLAEVIYQDSQYIKEYRKILKDMDNYYGQDNEQVVHWTLIGQVGITLISLLTPVIIFMDLEITALAIFCAGFCITFHVIHLIYYGFNVLLVSQSRSTEDKISVIEKERIYKELLKTCNIYDESGDTADTENSEKENSFLERNLEKWISQKKFRNKDINIAILAAELGTNRTTLSQYFNHTLGKSFREWLNEARLIYAKQLIVKHAEYTFDTISDEAGFSSRTYFYKVFSESEGVTPAQYKERFYR